MLTIGKEARAGQRTVEVNGRIWDLRIQALMRSKAMHVIVIHLLSDPRISSLAINIPSNA